MSFSLRTGAGKRPARVLLQRSGVTLHGPALDVRYSLQMLLSDKISARLLRPLVMGLRVVGRDADGLLKRAGVPLSVLDDPDAWISAETMLNVWAAAEQESLPHLGLRVVEGIDFAMFVHLQSVTDYLLVQIVVTSATVGEGLALFQRYAGITFGLHSFRLEAESDGLVVHFEGGDAPIPREFLNFALAFPWRIVALTVSRPIVPAEVRLSYPRPDTLETHDRVFRGAPLRFDASASAFRIARQDLAIPMNGARADLNRQLCARADTMLAELAQSGSIVARIRALIRSESRSGVATAAAVAAKAAMSPRTLSRRLEREGTSYRALADEVRASMAQELLRDPRLTLADVAAELGFADTSSFQRAFRRWFAMSPGQFRAAANGRAKSIG